MVLIHGKIRKLLISAMIGASLMLGLFGGLTVDEASAMPCNPDYRECADVSPPPRGW